MTKRTLFPTLGVLAALAVPVTALSQEIVVSSPATQALVEKLSTDLQKQLDRALWTDRGDVNAGYAIVRFTRDAQGEPENVTLFRRSGDRDVARVAWKAVNSLPAVQNTTAGVEPGQLYQANIVIADSGIELDRWSRKLGRDESARIAASPAEPQVLAFAN